MKLITLFLLISLSSNAQLSKKDIPAYACMMGAGLAYGQAEKITWHEPYSRNDFWNPYSEKHYTFNLNGYHICRGLQDGFIIGAVVLSVNDFKGRNKPLKIAEKIALCSLSFWAGQQITYNILK